jgi:hypothetical protein
LFQIIFIISVPQTCCTFRNRFCERRGSEQAVKAVLPSEYGITLGLKKMKNMLNAGLNVEISAGSVKRHWLPAMSEDSNISVQSQLSKTDFKQFWYESGNSELIRKFIVVTDCFLEMTGIPQFIRRNRL